MVFPETFRAEKISEFWMKKLFLCFEVNWQMSNNKVQRCRATITCRAMHLSHSPIQPHQTSLSSRPASLRECWHISQETLWKSTAIANNGNTIPLGTFPLRKSSNCLEEPMPARKCQYINFPASNKTLWERIICIYILGFHVTSEKTTIKTLSFYLCRVKDILKIYLLTSFQLGAMLCRAVWISIFFTMRDTWIASQKHVSTGKYRIALC